MDTIEEDLEGENDREYDFDGRLCRVRIGVLVAAVESPNHLQHKSSEAETESKPTQGQADESPSIPIAAVDTRASTWGIALAFGRISDKYPKENEPEPV